MAKKQDEATAAGKREDESQGGEGREEAAIYLLRHVFEPTRKQLMGLTNIPLGQVNNLVWMATFDIATTQLCDYMEWKEKKRLAEKNKEAFSEPMPEFFSLSGVWSEFYGWLRRSIDGSGLMTASTLAMKQLEMEEMRGAEEEPIKW